MEENSNCQLDDTFFSDLRQMNVFLFLKSPSCVISPSLLPHPICPSLKNYFGQKRIILFVLFADIPFGMWQVGGGDRTEEGRRDNNQVLFAFNHDS